jgi:uncharacterized protein YegL
MDMIPDVALKRNKTERLACVLIVDGSRSMKDSGAIHELNEGLRTLAALLKEDDDTADGVQIAILRMGGEVTELTGFVDAAEFTAPVVEADGSTPLGRAVEQAMRMIEALKSFTNGDRCFRIGERDFKAMFEWMSASMSAGSKGAAGQQMALPPRPPGVVEL